MSGQLKLYINPLERPYVVPSLMQRTDRSVDLLFSHYSWNYQHSSLYIYNGTWGKLIIQVIHFNIILFLLCFISFNSFDILPHLMNSVINLVAASRIFRCECYKSSIKMYSSSSEIGREFYRWKDLRTAFYGRSVSVRQLRSRSRTNTLKNKLQQASCSRWIKPNSRI